jgi:hypothetical protein
VGTWNVIAMFLVNSINIGVDKLTAKNAAANEGINSLLGEVFS